VASVAELKAAIDAAVQQISEAQLAVRGAAETLTGAQQSLAAALDGGASELVTTAQAAVAQGVQELEECLTITLAAVEQAQTYTATL